VFGIYLLTPLELSVMALRFQLIIGVAKVVDILLITTLHIKMRLIMDVHALTVIGQTGGARQLPFMLDSFQLIQILIHQRILVDALLCGLAFCLHYYFPM